jgi:hypothetical protein
VLRLKPVEAPCILQEIILYPNAINTVNIDTTTKPNEVYFEVEEPEEIDPDDPMAQFSGIIYNDGVLDITQDDPDNLNTLTLHFRDDVTKDLIIPGGGGSEYIAGSGIAFEGRSIYAKLGTGLTFDANDAIELDDTIKIKFNCNNEPD